ncbi:MAG: hypothetical protein KDB94_02080 [Acidobacteria bacterium]|nr:hypothetical protein [Acidobacteriota bacterium]
MRRGMILGSLLAAIAMFVWGFVFWTTPLGRSTMSHGIDNDRAQESLREIFPEDGVYFVPDVVEGEAQETWIERHRRGPLATVFYRRAGADPMEPIVFLNGFLHMLITCVVIAWLLGKALPALPTYGARLGFVLLAGFAATFWGHAGDPIWFYNPWKYHLMAMTYDLGAWGLAGLVLARFVRAD